MNADIKSVKVGASSAVLDILGPPALLASESEEAYRALHEAVRNSVRPRDVVEEMYLRDAVDYFWEAQRYRRAMAQLIDSSSANGLWRMLSFLIPQGEERAALVSRWAAGDLEARREVEELLGKAGLDTTQIVPNTMAALAQHLDFLGHQIHVASMRTERLFREIDHRRGSAFAHRLRQGLDQVEDAEVVETRGALTNGELAA